MQAPSLRCPRVKPALERERRANTASARRVGIAACTLRAGSRAACEAHAPGRPRSAADTREELAADACLRAGEDREAQAPEQRDAPILLPADAPARQRHGLEDLRRTPRQLRRQSAGGARRRWEETLGSEALTIRMMWCFGGFAPRLGRMVRAGTGASASHNSHVQWCPRFQRLRGARRRLLQWAERSSVLHSESCRIAMLLPVLRVASPASWARRRLRTLSVAGTCWCAARAGQSCGRGSL